MVAIPVNPLNPLIAGIRAIYQIAGDLNAFVDKHIQEMIESENQTISSAGRVLEGAKFGFGIGYITPLAITVVGQLILGNNLSAIGAATSGVILTNPLAMTCGAIGAIYYGWKALNVEEQDSILEKVRETFNVGKELIRAMINYVTTSLKQSLSSENLADLRKFVKESIDTLGRTVGVVAKSLLEVINDVANSVKEGFNKVKDGVSSTAEGVSNSVKDRFEKK